MDDLVDTINQLQEVFLASGYHGVDLPQIVVVGSQSSGKSSVLEHLVGKSILPRGTGIVTRCPLVLQLVHAESISNTNWHAIFQHNTDKVFSEEHMIAEEINQETILIAGKNKGICKTPIILKMYSPSFQDLTLVDLPGLTKVAVGDQPEDIEQQTRDLIMEYIENPNCIILAVTPANVDMATSESLKIAKEVDPEGVRTLAVITKVDLMDKGTNAWDIFCGKIIPIKLGIIGVVNRSQQDILDNKSIQQSLEDEKTFFNENYKSISASHGCLYLQKTVQAILIKHIKNCLPKLKEKINEKLLSRNKELETLCDMDLEGPPLLLDFITVFSNRYCSTIKGKAVNIQSDQLCGGARINAIFYKTLAYDLNQINALKDLSKEFIVTTIQNAAGANTMLFIPEVAFELLIKEQIKFFHDPCIKCVNLVHEELNRIVQNCLDDPELGIHRFPSLLSEITKVMNELLQGQLEKTMAVVRDFIDIQRSYINKAHPDFLLKTMKGIFYSEEKTTAVTKVYATERKSSTKEKLTDEELNLVLRHELLDKMTKDCLLIQELIKSYFSIVNNIIQDTIPKIIMHFLVNFMTKNVQRALTKTLFQGDIDHLLLEANEIIVQRNKIKEEISILKQANNIVNNFKPSIVFSKKINFPVELPNSNI